jgi:hypothetical protein
MGNHVAAQTREQTFQAGEQLYYTLHYKYGLLSIIGGTAEYGLSEAQYNQQSVCQTTMTFKSTAFVDKMITMMRDTLYAYSTWKNFKPLYQHRVIHEGNSHYTEDLQILQHGSNYTKVSLVRQKAIGTVIDTIITVRTEAYDFLNMFLYLRRLNYVDMQVGDKIFITAVMGDKAVALTIKYMGLVAVEGVEQDEVLAAHYAMDLTNQTFSKSKNAMEIWISADENRLPIKLRAQLKIGVAEARLSDYKNLKNGNYLY